MPIQNLQDYPHLTESLARLHFEQWGPLTGANSQEEYLASLQASYSPTSLPQVLVAVSDNHLHGSASIVPCDMLIRQAYTPWLAQVYVLPKWRRQGIGAALVQAAAQQAKVLGFEQLYLYTSGDLPHFYRQLGWTTKENLPYLGKERQVMQLSLSTYPNKAP